jgi:membrane protease YdiL (CAAX protease family)
LPAPRRVGEIEARWLAALFVLALALLATLLLATLLLALLLLLLLLVRALLPGLLPLLAALLLLSFLGHWEPPLCRKAEWPCRIRT